MPAALRLRSATSNLLRAGQAQALAAAARIMDRAPAADSAPDDADAPAMPEMPEMPATPAIPARPAISVTSAVPATSVIPARPPRRRQVKADLRQPPDTTPPGTPWPPRHYVDDGLRRIDPYYWTYRTHCKERWRGRALIDVFESEFRDRTVAYYRFAMESGLIFVNGQPVGPDRVLRNGDLVSHTLHRHEPPVTAEPIGIVHEDDDMLVINKPSGVPVHPAGRHYLNTVVEILRAERGPSFMPYPCNRLDRLTSGIMFVAKSAAAAKELTNKIRQRTVRKEYIARVMGEFPDGHVVCDQPILQISPKLGLNRVRASGKTARTVFKKLAYYPASPTPAAHDGGAQPWHRKCGYSVVRCMPVTGRTHQIRVHLQYLGHPIQNDPIYANQRVWGMELGRADASGATTSDDDVITRLARMGKEEVAQAVVYYDEMVDQYEKRRAEKMTGQLCAVCDTPLYSDPGAHELALWLHSLRYEDAGGSWSYVTPLPAWALPPDGVDGPTAVGGIEELVAAARAEEWRAAEQAEAEVVDEGTASEALGGRSEAPEGKMSEAAGKVSEAVGTTPEATAKASEAVETAPEAADKEPKAADMGPAQIAGESEETVCLPLRPRSTQHGHV